MKNYAQPKSARGFTILELVFTLTVAAVLLGIAAPNMTSFAKNSRITGAANDLLSAIYAARSEAIKQQQTVTLCFTKSPTAGTPACDGDGTQGWIVWNDANGDAVVDASEAAGIRVRHGGLHASLKVLSKPAAASNLISFGSNGFSRAVANSFRGIVLCDDRKNSSISGDNSAARGVLVETTGRPYVTKSYSTIKTDASLLNNAGSGTCVG